MNDTLLGIVIGGVLTMIPTLYNAWLSRREHQDERTHELRLKRYDLITTPNIDAILNFAEKLGACLSVDKKKTSADDCARLLREYYVAYERLYPYVSLSTRRAMQAIIDPFGFGVDDCDIITLNACLGDELHNALDDAAYPAGESNQKCLNAKRAKVKNILHSFFAPIKSIFSPGIVHGVDNDDKDKP